MYMELGKIYSYKSIRAFKWTQSHTPVWKCSCQNKHKVFSWLILIDRLSTRELLRRKNMKLEDYTCVLCTSQTEESLFHLPIDCPFASTCWNQLGLQIKPQMNLFQNLEIFRRQHHVPFYTEIIILMCWTIWQTRNGLILATSSHQFKMPKGLSSLTLRYFYCTQKEATFL